eukprot:jgi/Astpho2/9672/Aster-x0862
MKAAALLEQVAKLTSSYKALCKKQGQAVYQPLLADLAACLEEEHVFDKVCMQGPGADNMVLVTVVSAMRAHTSLKNISLWGCAITDEARTGLEAVAGLMQGPGQRWWTGPKLQQIEVISPCWPYPPQSWPERALPLTLPPPLPPAPAAKGRARVKPKPSPVATAGRYHWLPRQDAFRSFVPKGSCSLSKASAGTADLGGQLAPGALAQPAASRGSSPTPRVLAIPDSEQALLEVSTPGGSPPPGTPAAQAAAEALEAVALEEGFRADSLMRGARLSAANAAAVAAARAGQELPATVLVATAGEQLPMTPASVVHGRAASIPGQTAAALQAAGAAVKVQQMAKAEEAARATAATAAAQRGWERVRQPVQAFSLQALQSLAAGVGCHHGMLAVLNLSGVLLDDEGMKVLAKGIHKATRLKELRLSWCGVGPVGSAALADAITPVVIHPAVPTEQPKLTLLDLTEIAAFASMLTAHEGLAKVDLFGNLIGDAAAQDLLAALQARPQLVLLLMTSHISRTIMKQIVTELAAHVAANKKKRPVKKKAK